MAPKKRTTRAKPATTTTPTTTVTDAQLQALIDRGIAAALARRDIDRSRDGDNNHDLGTSGRRQVPTQRYNCAIASQVKYASCTLQGSALTWWNSHVRAVGQDVAYAQPWTALKMMIIDKYCPRGVIKKLKSEYWNLRVRAKVERYIDGLPNMIHGSVKASKPQSMLEEIGFATEMMDKKMLSVTESQAENKRKFKDTSRNNQNNRIHSKGIMSGCPKLKNGNQENRAGNGNVMAKAYAVGTARTNPNSNVVTGKSCSSKHAKVYYECMEPFKSLKYLWVRSKSIAVIWLEKVVTPLIEPAIKYKYCLRSDRISNNILDRVSQLHQSFSNRSVSK
uniref:Retrotransposon gag domain-containing protein n=1 Tax=Tanacetum cinerariifolium TaxID=118510 RepID=A0A6L2LR21_TANCI|nr:hypothetical protein [Tanacetum cinerariifolium]